MASILLVLTSSPHSSAGERALALAESLAGQRHTLILCCLQDAVFLARGGETNGSQEPLRRLLEHGARCVVLDEDLLTRGLKAGSHVVATDRAGVVALLAGDHDRVIGAL